MQGYLINKIDQEIVVNIANIEQLSATSVIFAGGLSLNNLDNEEINDILELIEAYSPGPTPPGPTPGPTPGPEIEPFYVPGWFEHQEGNWVLVKAGQTWNIQYSDNGSSWNDASYTAGDEDTWFNMDNEPFRMAKYARRRGVTTTSDKTILAMNLDMPNHLGSYSISNTTFRYSIYYDPSLINVKIKIDHFEGSLAYIFSYNSQMTTCEIEQHNPELMNVTNMTDTFSYCYSLQSIKGLENWNVSNVTNMQQMFFQCYSLQSLDLSNWDVSNVTDMRSVFRECYSLQSLDLSNWNVSNVTDMVQMFGYCYSLQSLKCIENWDTSNVTSMIQMFYVCVSLKSLDLSNWNVSNTEIREMFYSCYSLQTLDLSNWDVSNVTNMQTMFVNCNSLQSIKGIENWDVSNVTNMSSMFSSCYSLQSLDLSNWNVSNATNMYQMFYSCSSLQSLDLSNWNVSNATNMTYTFSGHSSLKDFKIKSKPKTTSLSFYNQNNVLSNDSLKWMADNFIDISGDDTYTNKTISGFSSYVKSRYMWNYFVEKMTAKGYTIA